MSVYKLPNGSSYKLPSTYTSTGVYNKPSTYKTASTYKPSYTYTDPATTIAMRAEKARLQQQQQAQKDEKNWLEQVGTGITDYNDPYALNSLNDAIFNKDAKAQRLGDWTNTWWGYLPGVVAAAGTSVWDNNITPIINATAHSLKEEKGTGLSKVGAFFEGASAGLSASTLNALVNMGETLDVLANPIKGAVLDGGEGVLKATGFKEGAGRTNYDYDFKPTGVGAVDWLANFGLELVSDPLNWVSFGGKAAVTSGVKGALKGVTKQIAPELSEKASKTIMKSVTKEVLGDATRDEAIARVGRVLAKDAGLEAKKKALKRTLKETNDTLSKKVIKKELELLDSALITAQNKAAKNIVDTVVKSNLPKSAGAKLYKASEGFQKGMLKATMGPSPVGVGVASYKFGKSAIKNKIRDSLEAVDKNDWFDTDKINQFVSKTAVGMHSPMVRYVKQEVNRTINDTIVKMNEDLYTTITALYDDLAPYLDSKGRVASSEYISIVNILDEFCQSPTFKNSYGSGVTDAASFIEKTKNITDNPGIVKIRKATEDVLELRQYFERLAKYKQGHGISSELENIADGFDYLFASKGTSNLDFRFMFEDSIQSVYDMIEVLKKAGRDTTELDSYVFDLYYTIYDKFQELANIDLGKPADNMETWYKLDSADELADFYNSSDALTRRVLDDAFVKAVVSYRNSKTAGALTINELQHKLRTVFRQSGAPKAPALKNRLRTIADAMREDEGTIKDLETFMRKRFADADDNDAVKSYNLARSKGQKTIEGLSHQELVSVTTDLKDKLIKVDLDKLVGLTPNMDGAFQEAIFQFKNAADAITSYNFKENATHIAADAYLKQINKEYKESYDFLNMLVTPDSDVRKPVTETFTKSQSSAELSNVTGFATEEAEQLFKELEYPNLNLFDTELTHTTTKNNKHIVDAKTSTEVVRYVHQLSLAYVTQTLASNPAMSSLMKMLNNPNALINQVIEDIRKADPEKAFSMLDNLSAYASYNNFVNSLLQVPEDVLPHRLAFSFLDALNSEGTKNPEYISRNLDRMWDGFIANTVRNNMERADTLPITSSLTELPKQQDWIELTPEGLVKEIANRVVGGQHNAEYDTLVNKFLFTDERSAYKAHFDEAVAELNTYTPASPVWFDIETTGFEGRNKNIIQLTVVYTDKDGKEVVLSNKFKTDTRPTDRVMEKLGYKDEAEFFADYADGVDETEVYHMLAKAFTDVLLQNKTPVLAGHNIKSFDKKFIRDRASQLKFHDDAAEDYTFRTSILSMLKNVDTVDTLDVAYKAKGIEMPSAEAQELLKGMVNSYTHKLIQNKNTRFMQPIASGVTKSISSIIDQLKDTMSARTTKSKSKGIPVDNKVYTQLSDTLTKIKKDITTMFKDINTTNKELRTHIVAKEDLVDAGEDIIHIMNKNIKGLQKYSAKKIIDNHLFSDIYDLPVDTLEHRLPKFTKVAGTNQFLPDAKNALNPEVLTKVANNVERKASYVNNSVLLKDNIDNIIKLGEFMRDYYARDVEPMLNGYRLYSVAHPHSLAYFKYNKALPSLAFGMLEETKYKFKQNPGLLSRFEKTLSEDKGLYDFYKKYTDKVNNATNLRDQLMVTPYGFHQEKGIDLDTFIQIPQTLQEYIDQMFLFTATFDGNAEDVGAYLNNCFDNTNLTQISTLKYNTRKEKLVQMYRRVIGYMRNINDEDYLKLKQNAEGYMEHMNVHQMNTFKNLSGEKLMHYMYNSGGHVIYVPDKELKFSQDVLADYAKQGIIVHLDTTKAQPMYYFVLSKDKYEACKAKFGSAIDATDSAAKHSTYTPALYVPAYEHNVTDEDYFETVTREFRELVNEAMPGIGDTNGELLYADTIKNIHNRLPKHIQDVAVDPQQLYDDKFFEVLRYDTTLLGTTAGKRIINPYTASNPLKPLTATYLQAQQRLTSKAQYASVFFNDTLSLNKSELFSNLDNASLLNMLKTHDEMVLTALVKDKHSVDGMKAVQLSANSPKDLAVARKLDAVIVPVNIYYDLCKVLNDYSNMPSVLKFINGYITTSYKAFMLASPGTIIRNLSDGIGKNGMSGDSPMSIPRALSHWLDTVKLYHKYLKTEETFLKYLTDNNLKISETSITDYFKQAGKTPIDQETFEVCYNFFKEGFGSMTDTLQEFVAPVSKKAMESAGLANHINNYNHGVYSLPFIKQLGNLNSHVEQTLRLSTFLTALENGTSTPQAMLSALKNHFDYANKSYTQRVIETFFPFIGFSLKNFEYYIDAYANKGWLANLTSDLMKPLLHFNSTHDANINYEDVPRKTVWEDPLGKSLMSKYISASELYHILSGNIQLDMGVTNKANETQELMQVLKLNPSVMDAVQLATNPLDEMYSRLLPILRYGLEFKNLNTYSKGKDEQFLDALPIVGTSKLRLDTAKTAFERSGNPLQALGTLAGLTGVSTKYKQFDGSEEALEGASKKQKNIWYAQAKAGWKDDKYNPYYQPPKEGYDMFKGFLAKEYAKYKEYNLPPEENPYVKYAHLVPPEKRATQAVYEAFNPSKSSRNASEAQVRAWYSYYKEHNLPLKQNPYRYYPKYNKWAKKGVTRTINNSAVFKSYKNYYSTAKGAYTPKTYSYSYQANPMYSFGQVAKMVNNWKVRQIMNGFIYAGKPKYSNYKTLRAMALKNMDRTAYRLIYSSR